MNWWRRLAQNRLLDVGAMLIAPWIFFAKRLWNATVRPAP